MRREIQILIVDDHPMTVKGYELFLDMIETNYSLKVDTAYSCDEVLHKMKSRKNNFFDIVLLDINLPPSKDKIVLNGEDLGMRLRSKFTATKIMVHTALNDQDRISNIFKSLNPEGFMIKSDLKPEVLKDAINSILSGYTYYSERTNRLVGSNGNNNMFVDSNNRKILYHLSKGERMKDLPKHVPLAMATIERRKKNLKMLFGIPDGSDRELLDIARAKGFI